MKNYDDIINTKWPPEKPDFNHPRMPVSQRAKIFLPFAALTGYEKALEENHNVLLKIDGFKFVKPVIPGDQLVITVNKTKGGGVLVGFDAVVKVGDEIFAKGSLTFTTIPKSSVEQR